MEGMIAVGGLVALVVGLAIYAISRAGKASERKTRLEDVEDRHEIEESAERVLDGPTARGRRSLRYLKRLLARRGRR
jgi:hypothetical protein